MRNLKKVLSLALALVMLLGMMVVGAGAATSFKDDDKIDNQVAVAVSNKIGVLVGDENGNFNPDGTLTRAEAAVAIARLDLGTSAANALAATNAATFKDVPVTHWGKPYIDYCAGNGYIVGDGNGNFNPNKTVTSVEFATMVSRMLGYDTKVEGIEGNADWAVKAAALARKAGLSTDVLLTTASPMDRDDMAQMVFNSLTAPLVEYEGLNVSVNGVSLTSNVKVRTHTGSSTASGNRYTYNGEVIKSNITPIRLCEEKFPDLRLAQSFDAFGRVQSVWTWKNVNIAGSAKVVAANFEFTEKKSSVNLNSATGDSETVLKINGRTQTADDIKAIQKALKATETGYVTSGVIAALTRNGRLVQVYLNDSDFTDIDRVVVVDTFVGQVSSVNSDKGTVTISTKTEPATATVKTFDNTALSVGDLVAYTAAYRDSDGKYYIQEADAMTPTATGVLTKWNGSSVVDETIGGKGTSDSSFTVDGQTYKYNHLKRIDDEDGNDLEAGNGRGIAEFTVNQSEVNVYLDKYNFALYVSGVESEKLYAAVIGIGSSNTHGSERRGVTLLLPNGEIKEVTAQMTNWDVMSAIDHSAETGNTKYTQSDLKSATSSTATDKNLVSDGVADIVTYTIGDNDIYKLDLVGKREITPTTGTAFNVYSGKYDMSTGTSDTTFTNGKSVITLKTRYDAGTVANSSGNDAYTSGTIAATETYYTTSKTIFMISTAKDSANLFKGRDYAVYTGYANAPTFTANQIKGVAFAVNRQYKNQLDVVYIDAAERMNSTSASWIYFVKDGSDVITTTDGKYYELPAVVDGELTTIKIDAAAHAQWGTAANGTKTGPTDVRLENAKNGLYAISGYSKNSKDIIEYCTRENFETGGTGTVRDRYDVLGIGSDISGKTNVYWACANNATFYYVNKDLEVSAVELGNIDTDKDDKVFVMLNNNDTKVSIAFVLEVETKVDGDTDPEDPPKGDGKYSSVVDETAAAKINGDPLNLDKAKVDDTNTLILPAHYGQDVKQQLLDALAHLGYTVTGTSYNSTSKVWTFDVSKDGMTEKITCDVTKNTGNIGVTAAEYALVTIGTEKQYVAVGSKATITTPATNAGTGFIVKATGDSDFAYGDTYATGYTAVTGKDAEIRTGYVKVISDAANVNITGTGAAGFGTPKILVGDATTGTALANAGTYAPAGSKIKLVFTMSGDVDLAKANAGKVETDTVAANEAIACSNTAMVDTTTAPTAALLTFVKTTGAKLVAGNTVTITYQLANIDLATTITITAATD